MRPSLASQLGCFHQNLGVLPPPSSARASLPNAQKGQATGRPFARVEVASRAPPTRGEGHLLAGLVVVVVVGATDAKWIDLRKVCRVFLASRSVCVAARSAVSAKCVGLPGVVVFALNLGFFPE